MLTSSARLLLRGSRWLGLFLAVQFALGCQKGPPAPTAAEQAEQEKRAAAEELERFRGQVADGQTSFDLIRSSADDRWMAELKGKPVVSLNVANRPITNDGLANLAGNTTLKELVLDGTLVTDAGMKYLATMPALENVSLSSEITDDGLAHIAGLTKLKVVSLSDKITDKGLHHLIGLTELEGVGPLCAGVTGTGIDTLLPLQKLSTIRCSNAQITDADLDKFAKFPDLGSLTLSGTKITDAGLMKLAELPKLKLLFVVLAPVTDEGIEKFTKARPDVNVQR